MFGYKNYRDRARAWIKKEIARYAQANMVPYTAARQSLDIYEMRLETLDTRLGKRVRELEAQVSHLEGRLSLLEDEKRSMTAPEQHRQRKAG